MEDWMDGGGRRKGQLISCWTNTLQDLVWAKEPKGELLISTACEGRLHIRLNFQEDPITNSK